MVALLAWRSVFLYVGIRSLHRTGLSACASSSASQLKSLQISRSNCQSATWSTEAWSTHSGLLSFYAAGEEAMTAPPETCQLLIEHRAADLLAQLSVAEKLALLEGSTNFWPDMIDIDCRNAFHAHP